MSRVEIYISMRGENFDPEMISSAIEVFPTLSHRKGDVLRFNRCAQFSQWCLSTGKIEGDSLDVYELSKSVIGKLSTKSKTISELKSNYNFEITFQVAIDVSGDSGNSYPAIGFEEETINFLASIGASIDIDLY